MKCTREKFLKARSQGFKQGKNITEENLPSITIISNNVKLSKEKCLNFGLQIQRVLKNKA
jgi:hypothetical protein